ncbi:MAG: endo-1,4-beta-xylanase [Bacteroidales bacterium]|nr:endo-1,4-beta-xylanase [Bacteroidales bacterium]
MKTNLWLSLLLASVLACACGKDDTRPPVTPTPPDPVDPVVPDSGTDAKWGLKDLAQACGMVIGAEYTYSEYTQDKQLQEVLKHDFDVVTFGNEMKHDNIVSGSGTISFSRPDQMVGWANDCGLKLCGHTLGWHSQQQTDYLQTLIDRAADADAAAAAIRDAHATFVDKMVEHFDVYAWDVVNEAFADDGMGSWRNSGNTEAKYHVFLWGNYFEGGTKGFADAAFRSAKEALARYGKKADLYINDYNLEWNPAKLESLCKYAEGNPDVTGVGSQMHCNTDLSVDAIRNMLMRMVKTGKKVRISELDVPQGSIPTNSQADLIVTIFDQYLKIVPEAQRGGITFWGVSDKNSWLGANKEPLLFDAAYRPKESYDKLYAYLLDRSGLDKE